MNYLCVDLGGTKTLICTIDETGNITNEIRFETPEKYEDFLEKLASSTQQLPEKFASAVMAVPGLIDETGKTVVAFGNRPWTNVALVADVNSQTGIELTILNDARLAGLAEAVYLKDMYKRVLYITVSTGIGGALAVDGELVPELLDIEFGHMPLAIDGKLIDWEDLASGRAIFETYGQRASDIQDPVIWKEIAHKLALGVGPACSFLQPDVIVFGGGAGQQADKFSAYIMEELEQILHPVIRKPQAILACHYKDEGVIYGCYELAKQSL